MLKCKNRECTGCGMCAAVCPKNCIKFIENNEHFGYPKVDKAKCVNCNLCNSVCPALNKKDIEEKTVGYALQINDYWINKVASGGAFTAIALQILKKQGVVFGVGVNKDKSLKYKMVDNENELERILGSKYYQCIIDKKIYLNIVQESKKRLVLVSGTPCQISALKNSHQINQDNLYTFEILCQGVPNEYIVKKFYNIMEEKENAKIVKHQFRSKDKYVGRNYLNKYTLDNGKNIFLVGGEDPLTLSFQRQIFLRNSCYSCHYANNKRVADFTGGDLWNYKLISSFNFEKGISILLCNNDKAKRLLEQNKECIFTKIEEKKALEDNIPFHRPVRKPFLRSISFKLLNLNISPTLVVKICCLKYYIKRLIQK